LSRLLVTTADQRTWKRDEHILFLGNWCRLPDETDKWQGLEADVLPYHWDDSNKYLSDYYFLDSCYEVTLKKLASILNEFHGTEHSLRYWRILVGPWLYIFIHVLYDRWSMVQEASKEKDIATIILNDPEDELIPRDLQGMSPDDIRWNQFLYSCAIKELGTIPWEDVQGDHCGLMQNNITVEVSKSFRQTIIKNIRVLLNKFTFQNEAFLLNTYLSRETEGHLLLSMRQIPKFWSSRKAPQIEPDMELRANLTLKYSTSEPSNFLCFLNKMLLRQIPTIYLEGYGCLIKTINDLPWPTKPKVIFTSNSYQFDEVFQAWTAKHVEKGVPLVIGQHGGFYGAGNKNVGEEHQVKIADRFLTWGWYDNRPSIYPFYSLISMGKKKKKCNSNGGLLLVTVPIRMVSFKCMSWPVGANQSHQFLNDQFKFAQNIEERVRKQLIVRIDKGADDKFRSSFSSQWENNFRDVEIDPSIAPIENRIISSRLFVYTYNSTGYLETLSDNIPTIIFWNPEHWKIRNDAIPYFQALEESGIFFKNPIDAAHHVNTIWDDINEWWLSPTVQAAREVFCENYYRTTDSPINELSKALSFS
jgi:putative transferase (TIGR04331 family)